MTECLGCNLIEEKPVTLNDGRVVCSSCECWRLECEARSVLAKPEQSINEYLADVEKLRGKQARDELRAAMVIEWRKQKK